MAIAGCQGQMPGDPQLPGIRGQAGRPFSIYSPGVSFRLLPLTLPTALR